VTSSCTTWAAPPSASISARSSFRRSVRREASTTCAPAGGQGLGEARAQSAGSAGDQRDLAFEIDFDTHDWLLFLCSPNFF
jgi:hypothetical protein